MNILQLLHGSCKLIKVLLVLSPVHELHGCAYTPEEKNTVIAHIRHFYGGIKGITKNIVSPSGVEILIVEPTSRFDCYTLVTCGAGASVMPVPDKATPSRCEFCMCMPPTWNTEDSWPIDWLLQCVSWLQQGNSWLACGHSLSDGTPLQDYTLMTSMLVAYTYRIHTSKELLYPAPA